MDWGLLQPSSQNLLLRDELVFHKAVSMYIHDHDCLLTQISFIIDILSCFDSGCVSSICMGDQFDAYAIEW